MFRGLTTSATSSASLSAFQSRIGLDLPSTLLSSALTHSSAASASPEHARLSLVGGSALRLFATEHLLCTHPLLPAPVISSLVQAYVGNEACKSLGNQIGLESVMVIKVHIIFLILFLGTNYYYHSYTIF